MGGMAGKLAMTLSSGLDFVGMGAFTQGGGGALLDGSEADGTNLITASDDLNFTNWASINSGITINNGVAPDGATTAARILESATTSRHIIYGPGGFAITGGSTHTYSVYAKSITRRYLQFSLFGSGASKIYAYYDLQTGTVTDSGTVSPSGGTTVSATGCQAGVNGFYKCSFTGILDGTSTNFGIVIAMSDVSTYGAPLDADSPSFLGVVSNGFYVWRPKAV